MSWERRGWITRIAGWALAAWVLLAPLAPRAQEGTGFDTGGLELEEFILGNPVVAGALAGFRAMHPGLEIIDSQIEQRTETSEWGDQVMLTLTLTFNSPLGPDVWWLIIDGGPSGGIFWPHTITINAGE